MCTTCLEKVGKTNYNNIYNVVCVISYIIINIFLKKSFIVNLGNNKALYYS